MTQYWPLPRFRISGTARLLTVAWCLGFAPQALCGPASGPAGEPTSAARNQSVSLSVVSNDTVNLRIFGMLDNPACSPSRVWFRRDGVQQPVQTLANGDSSQNYTFTQAGSYNATVEFCVGLEPGDPPEPVTATRTSNSVTLTGPAQPPAAVASMSAQSQVGSGVADLSWPGAANAATYNYGLRSQTVADWQQGDADTWGNWQSSGSTPDTETSVSGLSPAVYQFRVQACNSAGCSAFVVSPVVTIDEPQPNAGELYMASRPQIRAIWTSPQGCYVLFESQPRDCRGSYNNAHALIPLSSPNHEKMYAEAFLANARQKLVDIRYRDNGDCDTANGLLEIESIEMIDVVSRHGEARK